MITVRENSWTDRRPRNPRSFWYAECLAESEQRKLECYGREAWDRLSQLPSEAQAGMGSITAAPPDEDFFDDLWKDNRVVVVTLFNVKLVGVNLPCERVYHEFATIREMLDWAHVRFKELLEWRR